MTTERLSTFSAQEIWKLPLSNQVKSGVTQASSLPSGTRVKRISAKRQESVIKVQVTACAPRLPRE